jgi:hypothetical protein
MNQEFKYSILQYKHSELLGEAINIALLVYFPSSKKIEFITGNAQRIKNIYPEFNLPFFETVLKKITHKVQSLKEQLSLQNIAINDFDEFLHQNVLAEDATVLQFTRSNTVAQRNEFAEQLIDTYADLFLPDRKKNPKSKPKHQLT